MLKNVLIRETTEEKIENPKYMEIGLTFIGSQMDFCTIDFHAMENVCKSMDSDKIHSIKFGKSIAWEAFPCYEFSPFSM